MAILIGDNSASTGESLSPAGNNGMDWSKTGYTAVGGTASTAHLEFGSSDGGAGNIKICIHNSSGTLVANTGAIAVSLGNEVNGAISASLTSGSTYYIPEVGDGYRYVAHNGTGSAEIEYETDSYATPGNITIPGTFYGGSFEWRMWIEGTTAGGGGSATPPIGSFGLLGVGL